jgi:hypothetical protein
MKHVSFQFCVIVFTTISWVFGSDVKDLQNPWVKITKSRIPMEQKLMVACAPTVDFRKEESHPGAVDVYSNSIAIEYRRNHPQNHDYPIGSMFLKTKYSQQHQQIPDDLGTLMIKKANTGSISDWEFNIMNVKTGQRQFPDPQHQRNCINCHEGFSGRGYISNETENSIRLFLESEKRGEGKSPSSLK